MKTYDYEIHIECSKAASEKQIGDIQNITLEIARKFSKSTSDLLYKDKSFTCTVSPVFTTTNDVKITILRDIIAKTSFIDNETLVRDIKEKVTEILK